MVVKRQLKKLPITCNASAPKNVSVWKIIPTDKNESFLLLHFWYSGTDYLIFIIFRLVMPCSIDLAQGSDRWLALASVVMNLQVPNNAGKFLTS